MSFRIERDSIGEIKVPSKAIMVLKLKEQSKISKSDGQWNSA